MKLQCLGRKNTSKETSIRNLGVGGATLIEECLTQDRLAILILPQTKNTSTSLNLKYFGLVPSQTSSWEMKTELNSKELHILRVSVIGVVCQEG